MGGNLWTVVDPLKRRVVLPARIAEARERTGKHTGPDAMSTDEAKEVVETPHFIQESSSNPSRQVYYQYREEFGKPPYKRTVVAFGDDGDGTAISWSRYSEMVSGHIIYAEYRR